MEVEDVGDVGKHVNVTEEQRMAEVFDILESLTESGVLKINGESNDEENVKRITEWLREETTSETSPASHLSQASHSSPTSEPSPAAQPLSVSQPSPTSQPSPAPQVFQASDPSTSSQPSPAHSHPSPAPQAFQASEPSTSSQPSPAYSQPSPAPQVFQASEPSTSSQPSPAYSHLSPAPQAIQTSEQNDPELFQVSEAVETSVPSPDADLLEILSLISQPSLESQSLEVVQPSPIPKPSPASCVLPRTNSVSERRSMRIKLRKNEPNISKWNQEDDNLPQESPQPICDDDNDIFSLGRILDFKTAKGVAVIHLSAHNQENIRQKLLGFIQLFKWKKSEDSDGVKIARIKPKERTNYMLGMMQFKPKAEKKWSYTNRCESRFAVIMGRFRLEVEALPPYRNIETNYAFRILSNTRYKIINQETDSDSYLFYKTIKVS